MLLHTSALIISFLLSVFHFIHLTLPLIFFSETPKNKINKKEHLRGVPTLLQNRETTIKKVVSQLTSILNTLFKHIQTTTY